MEIVAQITINGLIAAGLYALIALGFNLIYGATKFFNLAHGVMATVGGYTVFFYSGELGWNIWFGIIFGVAVAGAVGYLLDILVYRPLRKRKATALVLLVASLGVFTALQSFIGILFGNQFKTLPSLTKNFRTYEIFGATITPVQLTIIIVAILCTFGLALTLKHTLFGKSIKAISDDEEVSKIIGINTNRIIGLIFFIGSSIAGIAGILIGFDTGLQPTMGLPILLKGIIAAIIGGVGNLWGGILGALLLGLVENFGIWHIPGEWKDVIAFALLILFLIFRPEGILKK